jgi:16S rRNA (uracil1498-N3)-methyltransferase
MMCIVTITGDDAHHLSRSLRAAVGDTVTLCDMAKCEYECELTEFLPDCVRARVLSVRPTETDPPVRIVLYQALPKGDKLDAVIQKAVECGVAEIVPFESERCVARAKADSEARKTERRTRIAYEAAKQCGRGVLPLVRETVSFDEMLKMAGAADRTLFCYEGEGTVPIGVLLKQSRACGELALVIGSEGGFSIREAQRARDAGFLMTGLGKRILRTETAPIFALACISCCFELSDD